MIKEYKKIRDKDLKSDFSDAHWLRWNLRYIKTYKNMVGEKFKSRILDLGCGTDDFSKTCRKYGYEAEGIDIDRADFEKDKLPYKNEAFNVVHFNAVLEHIRNPDNIMHEIKRILKSGGIVIINTPNWQMDFKNFYNDPTHVKPYTPKSLKKLIEMYGFSTIFLEPALICKPRFYWKLPDSIKWKIAARIKGGSKSILAVGEKK